MMLEGQHSNLSSFWPGLSEHVVLQEFQKEITACHWESLASPNYDYGNFSWRSSRSAWEGSEWDSEDHTGPWYDSYRELWQSFFCSLYIINNHTMVSIWLIAKTLILQWSYQCDVIPSHNYENISFVLSIYLPHSLTDNGKRVSDLNVHCTNIKQVRSYIVYIL